VINAAILTFLLHYTDFDKQPLWCGLYRRCLGGGAPSLASGTSIFCLDWGDTKPVRDGLGMWPCAAHAWWGRI